MSARKPQAPLVEARPPHTAEVDAIIKALTSPSHPFKVTYAPKWDGKAFTAGTVVCQHGRHATLEGAARCAAAHHRALREANREHFAVRIEMAPSVIWAAHDGRRQPHARPRGE